MISHVVISDWRRQNAGQISATMMQVGRFWARIRMQAMTSRGHERAMTKR